MSAAEWRNTAIWRPAPNFAMLREMAKLFGGIEPYQGDRWCIRFRLEGKTHRISALRVHNRWLPFYDRQSAQDILDEIRHAIRSEVPPLAAVSPYMQKRSVFGHLSFGLSAWTGPMLVLALTVAVWPVPSPKLSGGSI